MKINMAWQPQKFYWIDDVSKDICGRHERCCRHLLGVWPVLKDTSFIALFAWLHVRTHDVIKGWYKQNPNTAFRSGNTLHADTQIEVLFFEQRLFTRRSTLYGIKYTPMFAFLGFYANTHSPSNLQTGFRYSEPSSDTSSDRCVSEG